MAGSLKKFVVELSGLRQEFIMAQDGILTEDLSIEEQRESKFSHPTIAVDFGIPKDAGEEAVVALFFGWKDPDEEKRTDRFANIIIRTFARNGNTQPTLKEQLTGFKKLAARARQQVPSPLVATVQDEGRKLAVLFATNLDLVASAWEHWDATEGLFLNRQAQARLENPTASIRAASIGSPKTKPRGGKGGWVDPRQKTAPTPV